MRKRRKLVVGMVIVSGLFIAVLLFMKSSDLMKNFGEKEQIWREENVEKMTKRQALDTLFVYLYGTEGALEKVTFFEENIIGYKWTNKDGSVHSYLCEVGISQSGKYFIFELFHELYDSRGMLIRTQWIDEFAVELQSGECIPGKIELEDGTWELNPDYAKVD